MLATRALTTCQVDDDEFASTVVCAILQKFEAIPTCADDFESAVNRWDEQQDDQRLDVVGACLALTCLVHAFARVRP